MNRRGFMRLALAGGGMIVAGIVAIPALVMSLSPVLRRRPKELWVPVGEMAAFTVEGVSKVNVPVPSEDWAEGPEKGVFVWRPTADEVVVFSRNCTDLSCPVTWDPGSGWFFCPCHGGIFSEDGTNRAGPPSMPLFRYANRVRDGVLEIDLFSLPAVT